ncbi:M24 family metallopeptidase [Altererythrobacter aurantiacus]|uniref:M24 family metallopeptidase n=1 Tax=Parapontixanthobacter aurantiacus TaxID=1463599 RepID=A0A844ZHT2_9SPHN|nr:aminopeptidase P family protein [Parapontixanthobacter aurantiacus]MXO86686.1 M24 family metallopeptidase [Parapontixanthobacter aurantiacus]
MLMQPYEARLAALRRELAARELDGFVVPISDEHMSEYVGNYAQRLKWLTGFGGSAGSAVVLAGEYEGKGAAVFVDGRYTVQVREQVDEALFDYVGTPAGSPAKWIAQHAAQGARIGYDPWLHTKAFANALGRALAKKGGKVVPVESNPVDAVWEDRPETSMAPAVPQPDDYAGRSSADKRSEIADWLKRNDHDATVIAALDSVAWLMNIRGADIDNTPLALAYAIAHKDGTADLFIAPEKVTSELSQHLGNAVRVRDRGDFIPALRELGGKSVAVDPERSVAGIFHALEAAGATIARKTDPTILPKALKNPVEQQGHRDAQARDGAAIAKFLHFLSVEGPKGELDELGAAAQLKQFREETGALENTSFDTISAAAGHAALPHYKVDEDSNIPIPPGSIFLCDSGGQYLDGTTDITRTVWIDTPEGSEPTAEHKDRFTRVLKGHIAFAEAVFPDRTTGGQIDALARQFLWAAGVDYAHGTGHGVGAFLCVHEGPQRIAKPNGGQAGTGEPLRAGMICSNEPGYYKAGEFGIRIENLVLIEPREIDGAEGDYLGFETLTYAPIERRLIEPEMLTEAERNWLDDYHRKVWDILSPQLDGAVKDWLKDQCAPI